MNVLDYSSRRGAIVHLLPKVYSLLGEHSNGMKNIMYWKQDMNKALIDVKWKWVFAFDEHNNMTGILFYRLGTDDKSVYIEQLAAKENRGIIVTALLKKLEQTAVVKTRSIFYVSKEIKRTESEEILGNVGMQDDSVYEDGYQLLGSLMDAVKNLTLRYA